MKNIKQAVAKVICKVAQCGAGQTSWYGGFEAKLPKQLSK